MKALTNPSAPQVLIPVPARKRINHLSALRSISATLRTHSYAVMLAAGAVTVIATFLSLDVLASVAALVSMLSLKYELQ